MAPHVGLALATSFSAYINAILLYRGLRKTNVFRPQDGWPAWIARISIASIAMAATLIWLKPDAIQWSQWQLMERLSSLAGLIFVGVIVYCVLLWLQGLRPSQFKNQS
jgi:putative peptidoglycan lipid II flippase